MSVPASGRVSGGGGLLPRWRRIAERPLADLTETAELLRPDLARTRCPGTTTPTVTAAAWHRASRLG